MDKIKFGKDGLIPAIIQNAEDNTVLMMAYMNEEAYEKTLESDTVWFYSRSRGELWNKGATSGNYLYKKEVYFDCDMDTLLIKVTPKGPACHTGAVSCFFNEVQKSEDVARPGRSVGYLEHLDKLFELIKSRKEERVEGSYTNYLFEEGIDKILKKVGEEATEVVIAAKNTDESELIYETSDLIYHLFVLLNEKNVSLEKIIKELEKRS